MSTTTTVVETVDQANRPISIRELVDMPDVELEDWFRDLIRDGYCVVKGAISREHAAEYVEAIYQWLESFNMGFDRNDVRTFHKDHLPVIGNKGICKDYGVSHEDFVWRVRSEPGVIGAFARIWGTDDLIVSFDAINISLPHRTDMPPNSPWAHQDQDPARPGFRCLQGLVNLLPNGPNDGGLVVCKGGHKLSDEFHRHFKSETNVYDIWSKEYYVFKPEGLKWLQDHGCEWVKVDAEPGDLLLWDSRTPHYNTSPEADNARFAVYTCYMPVADATQEALRRKRAAFEDRLSTSHWPDVQYVSENKPMRDGKLDDAHVRERPLNEPRLSDRAFRLTGIPYIVSE
ncbi:hypothetical protein V1509DRAFT_619566 [Lipomyces kononenkoae]